MSTSSVSAGSREARVTPPAPTGRVRQQAKAAAAVMALSAGLSCALAAALLMAAQLAAGLGQ